jgi:hypothetical protein
MKGSICITHQKAGENNEGDIAVILVNQKTKETNNL